jgi:hypothetical protein
LSSSTAIEFVRMTALVTGRSPEAGLGVAGAGVATS